LSSNADANQPTEELWPPERIEALEQAAFARGAESARERNENEARVCELLERAARELAHISSTTIATNRGLLLGLAMEIAQKWVGEELKLDPSLFAQALNRVIADCETDDGARLRLHPSDHAVLLEMEAERVSIWLEVFHLEIVEDDAVSPGMFLLEGPKQSIDGTAGAICDRLRDALSLAFEAALPEATS
jgi:flagellar biosynthesis/type III secretory pathway protein FliH